MDNLLHHSLAIEAKEDVEVWADVKDAPLVTLYVNGAESLYLELTPSESRALAALLILAAEQQEKR